MGRFERTQSSSRRGLEGKLKKAERVTGNGGREGSQRSGIRRGKKRRAKVHEWGAKNII